MKNDWKCKEQYPDLSGAKLIGFDTETYDPNLLTKGPGGVRNDGYICGFSIATDDGFSDYYPLRHSEGNVSNPEGCIRWLKDQMESTVPKVGANLPYDCEWTRADLGISVNGPKYDVQVAGPLLDENYPSYSLDNLAKRHLGTTKEETLLFEAGVEMFGLKSAKKTPEERRSDIIKKTKGFMHKLPASIVGVYGEKDAVLPINIFKIQEKELKEKGLWDLFLMETDVLDLLIAMRFKGVPVDLDKAEQAANYMQGQYDRAMREIRRRTGSEINIWANEDLEKACQTLGLQYGKTPKGAPSFPAHWLEGQEHPFFDLVLRARQLDRSGSVFIKSKIIEMAHNGRIYPSFYQVKGERGGTVSGRFASSNPNAQQFPSRNKELATMIRSILVAEPGAEWMCADFKAQEPRLTVHYSSLLNLDGAHRARDLYRNDPNTDYHQMVADWVDLPRKEAKQLNLGLNYGMGPKKYAAMYDKTYQEARDLFNLYHSRLPFIKQLSRYCESRAKQRGYIKTLLGRHCNFNLFGPPQWSEGMVPLHKEEARTKYGFPIIQYFTYKALNRLIQGSAADMIKKAMVDCHKAGYIPNLTVHDELDFADITSEKQMKEIKEIMINAVQLEVPVLLDVEVGPSWGEIKERKI